MDLRQTKDRPKYKILLWHRFGGCAVEGLVRASLGYFGTTLVDVLRKDCSTLLWVTLRPLWWMCGLLRTTVEGLVGYFGPLNLLSGSSGLVWGGCAVLQDYSQGYFGRCAVERLLKTTTMWWMYGGRGGCAVEGLVWVAVGPLWGGAMEGLVWATLGTLWWRCYGRVSVGGTEVPSS